MKISCVIPTCNRAEYLPETLNSVLAQSEAPHEIIVVNNGEGPVALPETIKHRVKIYNIVPYAGVAQARNFGASLASGDFVAFLDDDDLWHRDYLKNIRAALQKELADFIISRLDQLWEKEIRPYRNLHNNLTVRNILIANPGIQGSNIVVAKNAFFKLRGFDPKLPPSEDKSLILEAMLGNFKIKTLPDNQAIWRMHQNTPRLIDSAKMAEGIWQFAHKYKHLMTARQYLYNLQKLYGHRRKTGDKTAFLQYLAISFLLNFIKIITLNPKI